MKFSRYGCLFLAMAALIGCGSAEPNGATGNRASTTEKSAHPIEQLNMSSFEQEGPFAAITGRRGDEMPRIDPPDRPAPKAVRIRDLKVGSGPVAHRGEEVSVYYAGAPYKSGGIRLYGWPPSHPASFRLAYSAFGKPWEESFEGMRVGGIREVIIPKRLLHGTYAMDYVTVLMGLKPAPAKP